MASEGAVDRSSNVVNDNPSDRQRKLVLRAHSAAHLPRVFPRAGRFGGQEV
jgi:hypothetical protein